MPKFNEFLFGKKGKVKKAETLTPEQQELMSLIKEGLASGTGAFGDIFGGFNEEAFQKGVADPALKNFQENILPQIQEKFIGGNQALGSGAIRGQQKAAASLQSELAKLMYEAQQQNKQNKLAGLQTILGTKGFENIYKPGTEGAAQGFVKGAGQAFGEAAGAAATGGLSSISKRIMG